MLSHSKWDEFREQISPSTLVSFLKKKGSSAQRICRFLDVLLFLLSGVIIFSYVFGGFAIDIGSISIFQVKNFHKPVFQLTGILLLRIAIYREDLIFFFMNIKSLIFEKVSVRMWRLACLGTFGFCLGLSPRIASILIGETSRGGQGFDTDILPTELGVHFWDLISRTGPMLFGFDKFQNLTVGFVFPYTIISWVLFFLMVALFLLSGFFFFFNNWTSVKKILSLNAITFQVHHIFILLPILVCAANIIAENGSQPRYLFPLFGTAVLWIGWLLSKFQKKTKWLPIFILILWVVFYSTENYQSQKHRGVIDGLTPVKLEKFFIYDLIGFLESNSIHVAYSDYQISSIGTYLSAGKINISEYTNNPWATTQKAMSMSSKDFAIIVKGDHDDAITYSDFLKVSDTQFRFQKIGLYKVFWDFLGDATEVNKLRSLING